MIVNSKHFPCECKQKEAVALLEAHDVYRHYAYAFQNSDSKYRVPKEFNPFMHADLFSKHIVEIDSFLAEKAEQIKKACRCNKDRL